MGYATPYAQDAHVFRMRTMCFRSSFAKEPYKRHDILQKRPIILRSLLIVATYIHIYMRTMRKPTNRSISCAHCAFARKYRHVVWRYLHVHIYIYIIYMYTYVYVYHTYIIIHMLIVAPYAHDAHVFRMRTMCFSSSFAKEPYKTDDILQKRRIILRSLLIVATLFYRALLQKTSKSTLCACIYVYRYSAKEPYKRDDILHKRRIFPRDAHAYHFDW